MHELKLTRLSRVAMLPVVAAALSVPAMAQSSNANQAGNTSQQAKQSQSQNQNQYRSSSYRGVRASELIGMNVRNEKGENLGEISDMVVNLNTGDVRYAILQFDPGIFSGERLFAVPARELRTGPTLDHVVYRMSRDRLERAAIDRSDWNRDFVTNRDRMARLDQAYGIRQPSDGAQAHRVSDLIGRDVQGRGGEKVGEIEELVVNLANQKVHYAVLQFDPGWLSAEKRVVFPLRSFQLAAGSDNLRLDVDKSRIQSMREFKRDDYANVNNPVWLVDVDRYLVTVAPAGNTGRNASNPSANSTRGIQQLEQASLRLRQSINALASKQPGPDRERALEQAHEALIETQRAMASLPPDMRGNGARNDARTNAEYDRSVQRLMQAADSLRKSIQAMAQQPVGEGRDRAIEQAHRALWDTQQAMVAAYNPGTETRTMGAGSQQQQQK